MSHTAPQRPDVAAGETRNFAVSFSGKLDVGELLTGTPTVIDNAAPSPQVLTIGNVAVNTAELTINDVTVPIGEAVQWSASGFVSGSDYKFKVTAATDSTQAQTLIGYTQKETE